MEVYFILTDPAVPENIGASARAIKTMGFNWMRLVRPKNYPNEKAEWLAHGSADILQTAAIYSNLEDAIRDLDFVVGTSSKERSVKYDSYPVSKLNSIIAKKGNFIQKLGIIFGGEESGLSNTDLNLCDIVSYVPLANPYPSLNLSQAVMLYAFQLSANVTRKSKLHEDKKIKGFRLIKERVSDILQNINIPEGNPLHNRIIERLALLNHSDLNLLHSISNKLALKFKKKK
ncbi:MAG: tRNA/rRNA methyltransferase [Bacteroidales bacterium]|nr:tRNA/rRNA methyltransferase [Bacteroidales bacterium]